ncbi:MAG TPA: EcsC family protein [Luteolibacter sp.]|nr:EcsC family protein [Luteolibacter sp.]
MTAPLHIPFTDKEIEDLKLAIRYLEHPGLAAKLSDLIGTPIDKLIKMLPNAAEKTITVVSEKAMNVALDIAIATLSKGQCDASPKSHKMAGAITGAVGGAAGLAGLAFELPVTTTLMFRSIADIARAEGEDLKDPLTCMACMEVFAFGGPGKGDDTAEGIYFGTRIALAKSISEAASYLAKGVATHEVAPALVRLISSIASRFGIVVSYKAAAQLAPVIGAIGGAVVNTLFLDHYQTIAKGHFIVRRLERAHGQARVRLAYQRLLAGQPVDDAAIECEQHRLVDGQFVVLDDNPTEQD